LSYRRTWLNRLGGEWLSELQVGTVSGLFTEFYQPVEERGRTFVAPYGSIGQTTRPVFVGEDRIAQYDVADGRIGLDAGAVLGTVGELRIGPLWRRVSANVETGSPVLPDDRDTLAGIRARLIVDQLDQGFFPRNGYRALASAYAYDESFGSDRNYKRLEGQVTGAVSWGAHTFNLSASGGTNLDTDLPAYDTFTLGGPLRLSAYRIDEFAGRQMTFGRLMYYNRALALPDVLGSGVYIGGSLEAGRMQDRFDGQSGAGTILSGSVFLAANTFLGPAYFGLGIGEAGRWSLYLLLGVP
jgi:NTE family protein